MSSQKTREWFRNEILSRKQTAQGPSEYGSRVMPTLQLYKGLQTYEERRTFQDALEILLQSPIADERSYAVDVCLGFFVFRDAI